MFIFLECGGLYFHGIFPPSALLVFQFQTTTGLRQTHKSELGANFTPTRLPLAAVTKWKHQRVKERKMPDFPKEKETSSPPYQKRVIIILITSWLLGK